MRALTPVVLAWVATALGCASPPERLYTLSGPEAPPPVATPTIHVALGPVTIPAAVDRPQLVVRQSAVRLVALEQERWAEPLREAVARVLADSMRARLPSASVSSRATAAPRADVRVIVDFTRFEALAGREVIIEAHWWVRSADTETGPEGTSVARVPVHGSARDYDAVVAAQAAGLGEIGAELSRAVEEQAARRVSF